jgi:type VI secretion system secreted protein VgrG
VYCFASSAQLTGTLTLNDQGDPNAVFVFQIGSTLTTASSSSVVFTNGDQTDNVFWQVGSSATLGSATEFAGNILALTSITLDTGANVQCGSALASNGAVTMNTNNVAISGCETTTGSTPEPGTAMLFGTGLFLSLAEFMRRSRKGAT